MRLLCEELVNRLHSVGLSQEPPTSPVLREADAEVFTGSSTTLRQPVRSCELLDPASRRVDPRLTSVALRTETGARVTLP